MKSKPQRSREGTPNAPPALRHPGWKGTLERALSTLRAYGAILAILGVLALIAAGAWYAIGRTYDEWVRGLLIGGLCAIAVYLLLQPQEAQRALSRRSARYGSNAVILSMAAIGIIVLLNYLSSRTYKRFDTTEGKLHSLSPQSIQIVQELDRDIEVIGVYPSGQSQEAFEKWLDEYRAHSDRLQYRAIDPIRQPGEAERLGWNAYGGGLLVRRGDKSQQVFTADEQDITSALLKVSRDEQKTIYFVTGHGEPSPTDYDDAGYGEVAGLLENNNYAVQSLNLALTDTVPADAAVVVVAGLKTPLLQEEKGHLTSYLLMGGKALVMVDPGQETGINDVLAPWKVRIENKLVVDALTSLPGDPLTPVIDSYSYSQITKDLPMIAFPLACPIQEGPDMDPEITYIPLGRSSSRSWAESDAENLDALTYDEGMDLPGPLTLIATIEAPGASASGEMTRLALIGDSDFVDNGVLRQIPNGQFLLVNAVNWLAEEEALIAIGPKTNVPRSIQMNGIQEGAVCFGTLVFIPAVIVLAGVLVWLKRR